MEKWVSRTVTPNPRNKLRALRRYFVLHWDPVAPRAHWHAALPPDLPPDAREGRASWRMKQTGRAVAHPVALVATGLPGPDESPLSLGADRQYTARATPFLISHLQKCVRRGDADRALKTTAHLMRIDFVALLRRLPVIVVEDAVPDDAFPVLVWLMCALHADAQQPSPSSCAWRIASSRQVVQWILRCVEHLCRVPRALRHAEFRGVRSQRSGGDGGGGGGVSNDVDRLVVANGGAHVDLAYAMLLRVGYGLTAGDAAMFRRIVDHFAPRPAPDGGDGDGDDGDGYDPALDIHTFEDIVGVGVGVGRRRGGDGDIVYEGVDDLRARDWVLDAVDFHCAPGVLSAVMESLRCTEADARESMWRNASNRNYRRRQYPVERQWDDVAVPQVRVYQRRIIRRLVLAD